MLADPGLEHRPPPAAEHPQHPDRRARLGEPGQDALVERRGRAAAAVRLGRRRVRGQPGARRAEQAQRQPGAAHGRRRRSDRPYFASHGRQLPISIFAPYGKTDYDALQVGVTRPLTRGLLLKGHYTFASTWSLGAIGTTNVAVPSYELPTAEAQDRNWNPTNGSRRHTTTMSFVYQLPWRSDGTPFSVVRAHHQRLAGQRHLPGVQRRAVHRHRRRHGAEHTRQHADRRSRRHRDEDRGDRRQRVLLRSGRVGAAGGGPLRHQPAQPVPRPRRLEPRLLGVPRLPDHRPAPGRAPHGRRPTSPTRRSSATRRATSRAGISCASSA